MIRIELFSLEPIGIGTAAVESQTSYLSRLAEAHCVTVGTLIAKVIAKELGKEYLIESCKHGGNRYYEQGAGLNGIGKKAEDLSTALYTLTGINVSSLTVQSWRDTFPSIDLFHRHKTWCPLCFEEWKANQMPIYEPLIWNFKAIEICGVHGAFLNTRCPLCDSEIPVLSRMSRNGYCSNCGCWLGSHKAYYLDKESEQFKWDYFVVNNISNLIINGTQMPVNFFSDLTEKLIDSAGGTTSLSLHFNVAKSTVSKWNRGLNKPSFNRVLKTCYSLGLNVSDLSL